MSSECVDADTLAEAQIDKLATQYRESNNLIGITRGYVHQVATVENTACSMLDNFDIDDAVGDQLTILGKVLGWPRVHCAGRRKAVFGFECDNECGPPTVPVGGFCEAEWACDGDPDFVEFTFTDDEMYRGFLKSRAITLAGEYRRDSLTEAARAMFGDLAVIWKREAGVVHLATGRLLSDTEISISHLYRQVLPVPPGIALELWHSRGAPFGFGHGWGGMCSGHWPVQITTH